MSKQRRDNPARPRHHRFALEPRQLFDGAAVAEAASHTDNPLDAQHHNNAPDASKTVTVPQSTAPAPASITAPAPAPADAPASAPHEVYVVDSHVQNWQSLVGQLPEGSRVLVLDSKQSGLEQINDALKNDKNISAIHIISHGASDEITLGSDKLNDKTIAQYQQQLEKLGEKLTSDGDILLYGCNVTAQDTVLITRMADYTHADVAASNDETGSAAKAADWTLESSTGVIETRSLSLAYDGVLQAPEITTRVPDMVVSEPGTLRPGAETGSFSGLTLNVSDENVAISVSLTNGAAGDLVNGATSGKTLEFVGSVADAQAWLNSLKFTASDTELGHQSASTDVQFFVLSLSGNDSLVTHISITPANDPVTVADSTLIVPERNGSGTVITEATLAALDPELQIGAQSASQIVYSLTAIPQYGYLTLNGTRLGVGSVFTQQDVRNGTLKYIHTATGDTQNTADGFSAKVNDGATPIGQSDTVTVTLEIAPENQPPTISGGGIVYEGQPQNATNTGNVGQYIVAESGGDTQDINLTLTITSLPSVGTLYFKGVPVQVGQQIDYAERNLLTYANNGEDGIAQDTFGVRVTDQGGGTGTPASSDAVIKLDIQQVDDDPVLDAGSTRHADVVPGPADVVITPEMLTSVDVDSPAERVSFIVDTAGLTHGYLTLNGLLLKTGDTFSMDDVIQGKVAYVQYLNAQPGGIDVFNFRVIDHSTALRWNPDGTTFTRQGGIWDGDAASDQLTHFQFTIGLVRLANNPTPDNVPPWSVPDSTTSSDYIGTDPDNPTQPPHGFINEGGSLVLSGTGNISDATPGMSYVVQGVNPDQIVYTYLGTDAGQSGLTIMKSDGKGGMVVVNAFGTFTQAQLDAGQVRFVHDGGENFEFNAHFSVSAGQVTLDARGNPIPVTWNPELKIFITPVNDAPVITGSSNTVIAEGETVYITTSQLNLRDPDDANSGSPWETVTSINGSNNYALNHEASGDNALKFVFQSLPTGGVLQYLSGGTWVTITSADIGTLKLDASLLKNDNSSGLRFVSNDSEVRSTNFIVSAVDRWGTASATNATVGIIITNVNDGPMIPATPDSPDITVPPDSPNNIGGQPANNPATVVEGGYVQLDSSQLQAYDPDSSPEQVQYTVSTVPAHGRLAYSTDGVNFSFLGSGSTFTQADINNGHIYYLNNGDETTGTGQNADGFNFTLSDGDKEQSGNHFAINVTPTNDKPTVTAPSGPIDIGGSSHAVNGFTVADPDITSGSSATNILETTVRLLHNNGSAFSQAEYNNIVLTAAANTGATVTGGINGYLVITGTVAQINAALAGLTVTFPDDRNAQYQVQVITDDRLRDSSGNLDGAANGGPVNQPATPAFGTPPGAVDSTPYNWYLDGVPASNGNITANQVVINASENNDPGTLVVGNTDKTTFEDQPTIIGGDITIADDESAAFGKPVTVTLTVPQGQLGIAGADDNSGFIINGVRVTGDNSGTLILTGTASDIQALLNDPANGLTYLSDKDANHDQNGTAAGDVTLKINLDTSASSVGNTTGPAPAEIDIAITITPVNDAPTVTAPTDTILLDNNAPGGNSVGGIVIGDPDVSDAGGIATGEQNIVQVTVRITDQNGNPFEVLQYRDQQNSAVNISSLNTTSGVTVQSTSPDGVNPPANGVNAPLVITGTIDQINAYLAQLQVRMSGIEVDDADQYFRVEVIVDDRLRDANGKLTTGANGGNNANPTGDGTSPVPTIEVSPYAKVPTGLELNVATTYRTVFQSSTNDPAHIDLGGSPVLNTNENSATVTLPPITLSDVDAGSQTMTVTVKLPNGFTFVAPTGSGGTVTGAGTDTLTFTGSYTQINTYLAGLKVSLPDVPGSATASDWNGNFGVTVTVNDGGNSGSRPVTLPNMTDPNSDPGLVEYEDGPGGTSSALITTRTFTFTVNPVNDAPVVIGTPTVTIPTIEEDKPGGSVAGSNVGMLFSGFFNDQHDTVDNGTNGGVGGSRADNFYGVAITQLTTNAAQGEWQYSLDSVNWLAVGNRSDSNALILTASSSLRFVPAPNYFGNPATLGVRLVETNANGDISTTPPTILPNGSVTNINTTGGHGGTSIYSETVITLSTVVTNINDRPTLGDKTLTLAEDTTGTQTVGQLFQSVYSDATDNQSAIAGGGNASTPLGYIAIYGNTTDASKGQWQYFNGTTWQPIPSDLSENNAFALASTTQMRFVPTADYNGSVSGGLQLRASDTTDTNASGIFGGRVNFFDYARNNDPTSHWSNTATISVNITSVVDAKNDSFTTHANVPVVNNASDLLANDSFTNADKKVTEVTQPANGTVVLDVDTGALVYTPNKGFVGTDTYTYTVTSGGVTERATVTINVTNQAPIVANENQTLDEDTSASGNVLTNDRDPDGAVDTLSVKTFTVEGQTYTAGTTVTLAGSHGILTVKADGTYNYTPGGDWHGDILVSYVVTDGNMNGDKTATLGLHIASVDDAVDNIEKEHTGTVITTDVLANDSFVNSDRAVTDFSQGAHGTVTRGPGNSLIYTPTPGYVGQDKYTYTVTSGGVTETATVFILLTNTPPTPTKQLASTLEDTALNGDVLHSIVDPDGDPLHVTDFQIAGIAGTHQAGDSVVIANQGTFILRADGTYTFVPIADWNGKVPIITFSVSDNTFDPPTQSTLEITVTAVQDFVNDSVTTHAGTPITIDALHNDRFSNADATITDTSVPAHGSVSIVNNQLVYTPNAGYVGEDSFTYTVTSGGVTEIATVTVTMTNAAPTVPNVYITTTEDRPILDTLLGGATDGDNDNLSIVKFTINGTDYAAGLTPVDIPGMGRITITQEGLYLFTPLADWNGIVPPINYTVSDGNQGGEVSSTLVITVTPVVDIQADQASTHSDDAVIINVLANDTFTNADRQVSVSGISAQGGRLEVLSNNTVRYSPPAGYAGRDSFTYTVTSGGITETTIVSILVTNASPLTGDMQLTMNEDGTPLSGELNVTDPDNDVLRVTSFEVDGIAGSFPVLNLGSPTVAVIPGVGTFTLSYDRQYTFKPVADWNGIVPQISYTVTDDNGGAIVVGKIDIAVNPVTDIADDNVTIHAGTSTTTDVFTNDTFINTDKEITDLGTAKFGTVSLSADGKSIVYTPAPAFVGNDSYTYTVTSGGITETATVYITVINAPPVAQPDVNAGNEDTPLTGNVLTNDTDADNSPIVQDKLTVTGFTLAGDSLSRVVGSPVFISGQGQFTLNADGTYTFVPVKDWNGTLPVITYQISDGRNGGTSSSTLTLTVTPVQDIDRDNATTHAGTPVVIDVLSNDTFENSDHQITATTNGLHGTTTIVNGKVVYIPVAGFVGTDIFGYTVTSGGVRETTFVTVNITNTRSQATDDSNSTPEDGVASGNVLTNDTDADNDKLTLTGFTVDGTTIYSAGGALNIPNMGVLVMQADGDWTFTPVADWNGTLPVVTYFVSDGNNGGESEAKLRVIITPVKDAFDDNVTVHGNTSVTTDVFANDTFANGDKIIQSVTQGNHGTVSIVNGKITYTPNVGYVGPDTYTYTVLSGGIIERATVNVTVENTLPVTRPDLNITPEDNVVSGNVLSNDNDPDGDPLTVTQFSVGGQTAPAGYPVIIAGVGEFTLRSDGSYTLIPIADWNGVVPTVTYTVNDALIGGNSIGTLNIIISPVADINADDATIHAGNAVTTDVLANDNFENPNAIITAVTNGANGSAVLQPDGQITYTPRAGFVGTDTYTYTVTSGGVTETTTVTVHVINSAPVVSPEGVITPQGDAVSGNLLTNDSDPDGNPIHLSSFQVGGQRYAAGETAVLAGIGSLTVLRDGSYTFTPVSSKFGFVPPVTYTVSDGNEGGETNGTLRILVAPSVEIQVRESGLTPLDPGAQEVSGTLDVLSLDKLRTLTFQGRVITAEQLLQLNPLSPITIETVTGTITLLAYYSPADGEGRIDYRFTLRGAVSQPGQESTYNDYAVQVNGATIGQLRITVFNDSPTATDDNAEILQDQAQESASGNLFNDDRIGADGAANNGPVTSVSSENTGNAGTIGGNTSGEYGTLTLDSQGNWRYQVNSSDPRVAALEANASLSEVFVYTITDSDGNTSEARLTILIHGITAMPNADNRNGDQMFGREEEELLSPYSQSYEPGLFILPLVYDLQSDSVGLQTRLNSRFAAYGYGIEHANAPVMQQAVLFSRWYNDTREQRTLPGLESNGLGQNSLGNSFGPFAVGQPEERAVEAPVAVAQQVAQPIEIPTVIALGAQPLTAQLAALEKQTLASGKPIAVPTITRR